MQYTRNTTMTKTDRDTLRSLHGCKKWEHIWAYYKLPIAIVLIVVYILGYTAYRHVTKKEDVLYLGLVNVTAGSDLTEQLTTGFAETQGLTKKQQVDLLSGVLALVRKRGEETLVGLFNFTEYPAGASLDALGGEYHTPEGTSVWLADVDLEPYQALLVKNEPT